MTQVVETNLSNFYKSYELPDAIEVMKNIKGPKLGLITCDYFLKIFPFSIQLKYFKASFLYSDNQYSESYKLTQEIFDSPHIDSKTHDILQELKRKLTDHIIYDNSSYYYKIIDSVKPADDNLITFTITTCKRIDLFTKTMNSFLRCCTDKNKISRWLCVDDNSSEEDRKLMKKMYPFMEFIHKSIDEKGHARSMNIIRKNVKTPYQIHMEDDWLFYEKRNYISESFEILCQNRTIGQCLFNKNYTEVPKETYVKGGYLNMTQTGIRYYIHEYCNTDELKKNFSKRHGNCLNSSYWPHFSFRPSMLKTSIYKVLGEFNEKSNHFEMDYAHRYTKAKYVSAFMDGMFCKHIGKLTTEKSSDKPNAYALNDEAQFTGVKPKKVEKAVERSVVKPEKNISTMLFVVNLKHRKDRLQKFVMQMKNNMKIRDMNHFFAAHGDKISKKE